MVGGFASKCAMSIEVTQRPYRMSDDGAAELRIRSHFEGLLPPAEDCRDPIDFLLARTVRRPMEAAAQ